MKSIFKLILVYYFFYSTSTNKTDLLFLSREEICLYSSPYSDSCIHFKFEYNTEFDFGRSLTVDSLENNRVRICERFLYLDNQTTFYKWVDIFEASIYPVFSAELKKEPKKNSETIHIIRNSRELKVLDLKNGWVFVKDKNTNYSGWLSPYEQCANEVTNCN